MFYTKQLILNKNLGSQESCDAFLTFLVKYNLSQIFHSNITIFVSKTSLWNISVPYRSFKIESRSNCKRDIFQIKFYTSFWNNFSCITIFCLLTLFRINDSGIEIENLFLNDETYEICRRWRLWRVKTFQKIYSFKVRSFSSLTFSVTRFYIIQIDKLYDLK